MGMSGKRVRRRRRIYKKLVLRGFRQGISRFLAIFAIVALGVGFFVGIIATAPDMRLSSDRYYDGTDMMDVRVVSTLGLTEADVDAKYEELSHQYGLSVELLRQQLPPLRLRHDLKLAAAQAVVVNGAKRK